jgi:hypothetical protein
VQDLDRLRVLARAETSEAGAPTVVLDESHAKSAIEALLRYFGDEDGRTCVALVIEGESVGYLERGDALQLVGDTTRGTVGGYGSSAGSGLPGHPQYELLHMRCPVRDCPIAEQLRMTYDEDDPPHCSVHPDAVLELA